MEPSWRLLLQQMWELEFCFEKPVDFNGGNRPFFLFSLAIPPGGIVYCGVKEIFDGYENNEKTGD